MLDKATIRSELSTDFSARYKTYVISQLTLQGYTPAEITAVEPFIDNIVAQVNPSLDMGLDEYEQSIQEDATADITNAYSDKKALESGAPQDSKSKSYEVFNAKKTLTFKEPIFSEPKFTSPVDIQDASYTVQEDYPDSYGNIDEAKNWYKINKAKNHVELVHSSGTLIKMDRFGNVTEHVKGNYKRVIDGDYSLEIKGNHDMLVKKKMYKHVGLDNEELIGANNKQTVKGSSTETVKGSKTESYKDHSMKTTTTSSEQIGTDKSVECINYTLDSQVATITAVSYTLDGKVVKLQSAGLMFIKGLPLAFSN